MRNALDEELREDDVGRWSQACGRRRTVERRRSRGRRRCHGRCDGKLQHTEVRRRYRHRLHDRRLRGSLRNGWRTAARAGIVHRALLVPVTATGHLRRARPIVADAVRPRGTRQAGQHDDGEHGAAPGTHHIDATLGGRSLQSGRIASSTLPDHLGTVTPCPTGDGSRFWSSSC